MHQSNFKYTMGWYDFEIPQLFIVENSKQSMNYVNTLV